MEADDHPNGIEDEIRRKELDRLDADIYKLNAEAAKAEAETEELKRFWYKFKPFVQAVVAGLVLVPLGWFYITDVYQPLKDADNIQLHRKLVVMEDSLLRVADALRFQLAARQAVETIDLEPGWNTVGYPRSEPMPTPEAFRSILPALEIVKDDLGRIYLPQQGVDDIGQVLPGHGYDVYMNRAMTLEWGSE